MGTPSPLTGCRLQGIHPRGRPPAPGCSTSKRGIPRRTGRPTCRDRSLEDPPQTGEGGGPLAKLSLWLTVPSVPSAGSAMRQPLTPTSRPKAGGVSSWSCCGRAWGLQGSRAGVCTRGQALCSTGSRGHPGPRLPLTCPTVVPSPPRWAQTLPCDPVAGGAPTGAGA